MIFPKRNLHPKQIIHHIMTYTYIQHRAHVKCGHNNIEYMQHVSLLFAFVNRETQQQKQTLYILKTTDIIVP